MVSIILRTFTIAKHVWCFQNASVPKVMEALEEQDLNRTRISLQGLKWCKWGIGIWRWRMGYMSEEEDSVGFTCFILADQKASQSHFTFPVGQVSRCNPFVIRRHRPVLKGSLQ